MLSPQEYESAKGTTFNAFYTSQTVIIAMHGALDRLGVPADAVILEPGGVLGLVTSHFTLDKQNAAVREYLAARADFVGAIRLPSDAFKREGTNVVTDIVLLRKRSASAEPSHIVAQWLQVGTLSIDGADVAINRYFLNHPEMVLGTCSRKGHALRRRWVQRHRDRGFGAAAYQFTFNDGFSEPSAFLSPRCLPKFLPFLWHNIRMPQIRISSTPDKSPAQAILLAANVLNGEISPPRPRR